MFTDEAFFLVWGGDAEETNFIGLKIEYLLFSPGKGLLELCDVLLPAISCKRSMPNDISCTVIICRLILF